MLVLPIFLQRERERDRRLRNVRKGSVPTYEKGIDPPCNSYKDAAAAEAHKESAHFAEARKAMDGKLSATPSIQVVVRKGGFRRG